MNQGLSSVAVVSQARFSHRKSLACEASMAVESYLYELEPSNLPLSMEDLSSEEKLHLCLYKHNVYTVVYACMCIII